MWAWRVSGEPGIVRGCCDDLGRTAGWVELFLTRTPGEAEAVIDGPGLGGPVRIGARDGVVYQLGDGHT